MRGIGADLAVVADHHAAELRHVEPAAGFHRQAETGGADHRARMHDHALAQADAGDQGDARDQFAAGADDAVVADHAARADHGTGFDAAARADADEGPMCAPGSTCARRRRRPRDGCPAGAAAGLEQRGHLGESRVGIACDQRGAVDGHRHPLRASPPRWPALSASWLRYLLIGEERQLPRLRARQRADAVDAHGAIALQARGAKRSASSAALKERTGPCRFVRRRR